jgi:hypothetical protein
MMLDFNYGAYESGSDLEMLSGTGELKGKVLKMDGYYAAFVVYGEKIKFVATDHGKWSAFTKLELWYASTENYHAAMAA